MVVSRTIRIGVSEAPVRGAVWTLLPNGDFSSPTAPPTLGSGVTISSGRANAVAAGQILTWAGVLTIGHSYRITLDYSCSSGSKLRVNNSSVNGANTKTVQSVTADSVARSITFLIFVADNTDLSIEADTAVYSGWIDNVVATEFSSDTAILPDGDFTRVTPSNQTFGANATPSPGALTCAAALSIVSWTTVLSVGQQYSVAVNYNCSSGSHLRASNNATDGTNIVDIEPVTADSTNRTLTFATFTATSADFTVGADTAAFSGTITSVVATVVGAAAHSLTCATGAFALSGQAMTLAVTMSAATGAFTLTGTAATLAVTISAPTAAFALTGNAALLKAARIFSLATGTFTLTGNAATLAVGLSAVTGSFVLAGQSATLAASMPAATGAFVVTGIGATLPVRMTAAVGSFALTGNPATLKVGHVLSVGTASFALTGNAATLALAAPLVTGAFSLSGQAATLAVTIPALTGSFSLTGIAATLTKTGANSITAVTASFALTGYAAALIAARRLAAIAASFSLTGSAASLGVTVPMGAGAFALTGYPGIFKRALIFSAAGQSFVLRGFDAILDHEGKSVTYPLAGIAQPYPGTPAFYPLVDAQGYPLTQPQTYPLEGIPQQYPLAS